VHPPANYVPSDAIADLAALYERGRYVAAHALAVERHGPLQDWSGGTGALVFGGRLAANIGGDRLSHALGLRALRRVAADPLTTPADRANAALFQAFRTFGRRGPLALRRFLKRRGVRAAFEAGATPAIRSDVLCLEAQVAAAFRDTDAAESRWQQAVALTPERAWTWVERAALLVLADRYAEALDAAHAALRLHPWYRPALEHAGRVLTLLGRDDEAVALLENALDPQTGGGLESPALAAQLAELCAALRRPGAVLRALDRFEAWSPLLEAQGRLWLASRLGEARLQLGDAAGSAAACEPLAATSLFYEKTVPRLRDPERQAGRRVVHAVAFIRQHERTCAPATLAALTHFWRRPADHAAIAGEICYGGTFDHQERHWAQTHNWAVREFRADWPGAVALLDAGIPFALATTAINTGHLQAVIGYDARRGTLIIRDPHERQEAEVLADEFFRRYALWGPRAMAIVPADAAGALARLRAADLPETALFDGLYRLRRALHLHDRAAARTALDELETLDPGARLTFFARRELAYYDGDDPAALAAVEELLARFPDEGRLRLEKLTLLRRLARPVQARAWLETCAADRAHAEPNLWRELARELAADPREQPRARQLLARCLFYEPAEAEHLRLLAELVWGEGDHPEAAALFRLAATSAGTREINWQQFFVASRHVRETGEALRLLDARFRRLGGQSSQPGRTLYWAHRERHEFAAAAAVLEEGLARRPEDGDLLLFAATAQARDGEHATAARHLDRARGKTPPGVFSRAAAELAGLAGDAPAALAHWRDVLAREPLDAAAHGAVARLLAQTDARGAEAAREHLDAATARFPHAIALHELRIAALADDPGRGTPEHADAVAALLAVQPTHLCALRENALGREALRDLPGALVLLEEAERLDPLSPPTHALRGRLLLEGGNRAEAAACLRRALELDADQPGVLGLLLEATPTAVEKRSVLDFTHGLLVRQAFIGDGILAYRAAAYPIVGEPELRSQLDAILAGRPDLWQAWSAVLWQHADAGRLDLAHAQARAAAERFALLPSVWLDLAAVEKIRGDDPAEVAALERALRIEAANGEVSRRLAAAHRRAGRFDKARTDLREAVRRAPGNQAIPGPRDLRYQFDTQDIEWSRPDTGGIGVKRGQTVDAIMLVNIQILRALAVYLVVFEHSVPTLAMGGRFGNALNFGHSGVDIFFVISGFIMVITTDTRETLPGNFMWHRIVRIVPLYWTVTIAVFAVALVAPALVQATQPTLVNLLKSWFFIAFVKSNGLVQPVVFVGWTLNYEMFFYVLFAFSLLIGDRKLRLASMLSVLVLLVIAGVYWPVANRSVAFYMDPILLEFGAGMFLGAAWRSMSASGGWQAAAICGLVAGSALIVVCPTCWPWMPRAASFGIPAFLLVGSALILERAGRVLRIGWIVLLGNASYSIYLTHFFVTQAFKKLAERGHLHSLMADVAVVLVSFLVVAAVGIGVHLFIEKPFTAAVKNGPLFAPLKRIFGMSPVLGSS
jgi:peptidoglycan/LPS O-acetylase OafA/YrhL/tetratricopeptide (TPR) repeat protein